MLAAKCEDTDERLIDNIKLVHVNLLNHDTDTADEMVVDQANGSNA